MAKCRITGKRPLVGNRVSHSNIKTKHWQQPNVQKKRIYDEETGNWISVRLSTRVLRTITKKGLAAAARQYGFKY